MVFTTEGVTYKPRKRVEALKCQFCAVQIPPTSFEKGEK